MAVVWFRERDKSVWHRASERLGEGWYRVACLWEFHVREVAGIWPQKAGEPGPEADDRCHSCEAVSAESADRRHGTHDAVIEIERRTIPEH